MNGVVGENQAPTGAIRAGRGQSTSLKSFVEQRRAFLLNYQATSKTGT
jgi:hypothetical protein